jgi:hypothetical protein
MATVPTSRVEAQELMLANSGYRWATSGTTKVEQYITAVEYLILTMPERATHGGRGGEEIVTNLKALQDLLKQAEDWREAQSADQGVKYYDFTEFRS